MLQQIALTSRTQVRLLLVGVLAISSVLSVADIARATDAVSIIASSSSVAPGSKVDLTASMPVVGAGTTEQTLTQTIDPTKIRLTGISDIKYPQGWTLKYSTDGSTFTTTTPSDWSTVKAVRATGPVVSQGSISGKQIAVGTASSNLVPATGTFNLQLSAEDTWYVSFDDDGRMFTTNHHKYGYNGGGTVICRNRDGTICTGWNSSNAIGFHSMADAMSWIDADKNRMWIPTRHTTNYKSAFACIDITPGNAPTFCNLTGLTSGLLLFSTNSYNDAMQMVAYSDGRLFGFDLSTGKIACADISGDTISKCTGTGYVDGLTDAGAFSNVYPTNLASYYGVDVKPFAGKLWVAAKSSATSIPRIACIEPLTGELCSGWTTSTAELNVSIASGSIDAPVIIPDSAGNVSKVCGYATAWRCWTAAGATTTVPTNFASNIELTTTMSRSAQTIGTKIYSSQGLTGATSIKCYDAIADAACSGYVAPSITHYTFVQDPLNPSCMWTSGDDGGIHTFSATTGGSCTAGDPAAIFKINTVVPRLGCSSTGAISAWREFTLNAPAISGYSTATVSIMKSDGTTVYSHTLTAGVADLSADAVANTGQNPIFKVTFTGLTATGSVSASLTATGDAPQLCLSPTAQYVCPTTLGPVTLVDQSTTANASGSSVAAGVTSTLTGANQGVTITAPSASTCSSTISGRAGDGGNGATGSAIAGVVVTLLDSSGNIIMLGGSPVTATTDANGAYSFSSLAPGTYKLKFSEPSNKTLVSGTVVSGASGTSTGTTTVLSSATEVTTNSSAILVGTAAVVNALYSIPATSSADTSSGAYNTNQTISPLANDTPTTGATFTNSTLKLCGINPVQTPNNCTQTSITTPDGIYTVNANGTITFDPSASFTGTSANPVTYQISDSSNAIISSTITPAVTPPSAPTASADTSIGTAGQSQTSPAVVTNDSASGSGNAINSSSVKMCLAGESSPNCTGGFGSSLVTSDGTYVLNYDGTITFTPASGFTGTPSSPIHYQVSDSTGQTASATYTPTVVPAPTVVADTQSGLKGATQTKNLITNDSVGSGASLVAASVRLCDGNPLPPNCDATTLTTADGSYSVNSSGVISFVPNSNFTGQAAEVTYSVTDSLGGKSSSTFTATVYGVPSLMNDVTSGAYNQPQTINLITNAAGTADMAGYGTTLDFSSIKICSASETAPNCTATSRTIVGTGTFTVNASGVMTFTPDPSFHGTTPAIPYTVTDSQNQKGSATFTATVAYPAAPSAASAEVAVLPGQSATFTAITSGSTPLASGTSLQTSGSTKTCLIDPATTLCGNTVTISGQGTYTLDPTTGIVTYVAVANASGTLTPVTYKVTDITGQNATATLQPIIPPPPSASPDTSVSEQGVTQQVSLLGNDRPGISAGNLVPSSTRFTCPVAGASSCSGTAVTIPGQGVFTLATTGASAGLVTFTPDANFTGNATNIGYTVADNTGQTASSTLTMKVLPKPAPAPVADTGNAAYGQAVQFSPWLNDSAGNPPAGNFLPLPNLVPSSIRLCDVGQTVPNCSATSVTTDDGTYVVNTSTGVVTFTPASGFIGTATSPVTYQITNDWTGPAGHQTGTAMLIPTIAPPGSPIASNDAYKTAPMTPITVDPLSNDVHGSGTLNPSTIKLCDVLEIAPDCTKSAVTTAVGTFTVASDGTVTFTPNSNFDPDHPAVIDYVITDSLSLKTFAQIIITDPPAATTPEVTPINTSSPKKKSSSTLAKTGYDRGTAIPMAIALLGSGSALIGWNHANARKAKHVA